MATVSGTRTSGQPVDMLTNTFLIKVLNTQPLYQYKVDFKPAFFATDNLPLRMALVDKMCLSNRYVYDGTIMFCSMKLTKTEFVVETRQEKKVTITLQFTNEVTTNSDHFLQLVKIID